MSYYKHIYYINRKTNQVYLLQTIEERVNSPSSDTKYSEVILATIVETGVGAHGNRIYNLDLLIPIDTDLPNFDTCTLFKQYCEIEVKILLIQKQNMLSNIISYFQVEAKLPGPHTNMRLEQKVRLGHIPPRSIGKTFLSPNNNSNKEFTETFFNLLITLFQLFHQLTGTHQQIWYQLILLCQHQTKLPIQLDQVG